MSIDERQRHELYEGLVEALGPERADTLMEHLPPVGWADVATKHDVSRETALLRSDLKREVGLLRGEMRHLDEVVTLRLEVLAAELRSEIHLGFRNQLFGIFGSVMAAALLNQVLAEFL